MLADCGEPETGRLLDLAGRDEYGAVTWVDPGQTPEHQAQPTVRVQGQGHVTGWVELTLQLDGPAQGRSRHVRHLQKAKVNMWTEALWEVTTVPNPLMPKHYLCLYQSLKY